MRVTEVLFVPALFLGEQNRSETLKTGAYRREVSQIPEKTACVMQSFRAKKCRSRWRQVMGDKLKLIDYCGFPMFLLGCYIISIMLLSVAAT